MPKTRLLLLLAVAATAVALAAPGAASADTITAHCSPGDCTGWHKSNVGLSWSFDPDPPDSTTCAPQTVDESLSGTTISCDATWGADTVPASVSVLVDTHPPVLDGATLPAPGPTGWYT